VDARRRAHVDHVVGDGDHVGVVLDDEHRVALVAQRPQQVGEPADVVRMQPGGRLVEDVGHAAQAAPEVSHQLEPLGDDPRT